MSAAEFGQPDDWPSTSSRPPPASTKRRRRSAEPPSTFASFMMTPSVPSRSCGRTVSLRRKATSKRLPSEIANARRRYRLASLAAEPPSTMSIESAVPGETTKWRASSAGSSSPGTRTEPRVCGCESVNGWNVTVADPFGGMVTERDWSSWPSTSRDTITSLACSPPRRASRAVGVTLSRPETASRARATSVTWMLSKVFSPSWTGVTFEPGGSRIPSSPVQPLRWKSVSKKTSPLGSSDSSRIV